MATHDPFKTWMQTAEKNYEGYVRGGRLVRFAQAVESHPAYQYICSLFVSQQPDGQTTAGTDETDGTVTSDTPTSSEPIRKEKVEVLFDAARIGLCETLETMFKENVIDANLTDEDGVTALHVAADNDNYDDVKFLLNLKSGKAQIKADKRGLTPLHLAASSAKPNPEIAELLAEAEGVKYSIINATVSKNSNAVGNTALHFAAYNENMSREFIQKLGSSLLDPSMKNDEDKTAFHIAAEAENPDIIVSMLEVFSPAKSGWIMEGIEMTAGPTLLEICAKKGNAEAVTLLIKYGAKMSENVFFYLIDESANNPTKTEKLIGVYRTLTKHCVLWQWLTDDSNKTKYKLRYPRYETDPEAYAATKRKIMLGLLIKPNKMYGNKNVLEYAIVKGDKALLNEIINTADVFRMTDCVVPLNPDTNRDNKPDQSRSKASKLVKYDVTYNITDFLNLPFCCGRKTRSFFQTISRRRTASVEPQVENSPRTRSYLHLITRNRHIWENSDMLQLEPFHTITQPMCWIVQRIYLLMALIQLLYMTLFSISFMPSRFHGTVVSTCSLKQQLNPDLSTQCNSSAVPPEPFEVNVPTSFVIWNLLWLFWPTAICVVTAINRFPDRQWVDRAYGCFSARLVFAPLLWAWYVTTFVRREMYLSLTSLVHLFGWIVTLSFFVSASEKASIFSFLLTEIMVKDIASSFGIVFVFVVISFSSAIHLLRESALLGESSYIDTMYNVFAAALTTGEFMSETVEKPADVVARYHLLQAVFAIYLCCATIILLNILITMMNNRYEEARKKAQNIWRFQTVHSWIQLCRYFRFSLTNTLYSLNRYWEFATHKFWGKVVNTTYDEVTIAVYNNKVVLLHMKYTVKHDGDYEVINMLPITKFAEVIHGISMGRPYTEEED